MYVTDLDCQEVQHAMQEEAGGYQFTKRYALPLWCCDYPPLPRGPPEYILSLKRFWLTIWRTPGLVVFDMVRSLLQGIIFGTVFWFRPMDQLGINEQFSVIFFAALFSALSAVRFLRATHLLSF
jgi:hypothetical protein